MRKVARKLNNVFNWLAEKPKSQYTLGELIVNVTDGEVENPFGYTEDFSRIGRLTERVATASAVAASVTLATVVVAPFAVPVAIAVGTVGCFVSKPIGLLAGRVAEFSNKVAIGVTRKISKSFPPKIRN